MPNTSTDYGDSMLKLAIGTSDSLSVTDYFTPSDVFSYGGNTGLCINDEDFGSGGVMLFPDSFYPGYADLMINGDKQSNFYVVDRGSLGGVGGQLQQTMQPSSAPTGSEPGYWSNPAYWEWGSNPTRRAIYYSVDSTSEIPTQAPKPLGMYTLQSTAPPVSQAPLLTNNPGTAFCAHGAQPSVSSNTSGTYQGIATTGIVWAYEDTNSDNPNDCNGSWGRAALHAYDASNVSNQELYNSRGLTQTVSYSVKFATPVVFNGKVYIGTQYNPVNSNGINDPAEVDVFGLCGQPGQPACFAN